MSMRRLTNPFVLWILSGRYHRVLSGAVGVLDYEGRRSHRPVRLPVQYARSDEMFVVCPANPDSKLWWRNFERPHPSTLLIQRQSVPVTGVVIRSTATNDPLAAAYLERFPKVRDVSLLVVFTPSPSPGSVAAASAAAAPQWFGRGNRVGRPDGRNEP